MSSNILPRFAITEVALRLLHHTENRLIATSAPATRSRITRSDVGFTTSFQWGREAGFFRIVSITESFVDTLSEYRLIQLVNSDPSLMRLVEDVQITASNSWSNRRTAFKNHHEVDINKCAKFKAVDAAVQVRNCLAHGLGSLTLRLRRNPDLPRQVATLDVSIGGGRMHLGHDSISLVSNACREFVLDLDQRVYSQST